MKECYVMVSLQKGQKVDLTKGNAGLKKVMVGLGWDEVQQKGGLLSGIFGGKKEEIDCDAIVFLLNSNGRIAQKQDIVYFGNLNHSSGCLKHMGDNLTGAGVGDAEQISIDLAQLPQQHDKIVILVSIYEAVKRGQHFGMIQNAYIRIVDAGTNKDLCVYNLSENYSGKIAMVFGELYRHGGDWKFAAIGDGLNVSYIVELAARYGFTG
jgi:stress response protein SCP2